MVANQRDWASPPRFDPIPYRLADAVDGPRPFTGHQKFGVNYLPDSCSIPLETTVACVTGLGDAKEPTTDGQVWRGTQPFAVYTWDPCGLVGQDPDALRTRTLLAHTNNAQTVVERVFWSGGDFDTSQHLAANTVITDSAVGGSIVTLQTAAEIITGTYDVVEAIGLLEEAMAGCYGGTPLIHVPRAATAHLAANYLIKEKGPQLRTIGNNSIIVPAPGYQRTGPDGTLPAAGNAWFYATGSVAMWRSEVEWQARDVREFLGRSINDTVLIAEQWFMLGWDCCHFAIQVRLGGTITGSVASAT